MYKLTLVVLLFTVFAVQFASGNAIQKRNTDDVVEKLIRLQRDVDSSDGSEDLLRTIINGVINIILSVIFGSLCASIQPYLTVLKVFQSTILVAVVLVVDFVNEAIIQFEPDVNNVTNSITSGVNLLNNTISDLITLASNSGCVV